jgi:hypothetical protein
MVMAPPNPPLEMWFPLPSGWDGTGRAILTGPNNGAASNSESIQAVSPAGASTPQRFNYIGWSSTGGTQFWQATFAGFERRRSAVGCQ